MKKPYLVFLMFLLPSLAILSCTGRHVAQKPDTTIPSIVSTSPANGASAIAVTTAVSCSFSEAMNASTINGTSFLLVSTTSSTATTVAGSVTYDLSNNIATFSPINPLEHNTVYTATITSDITDLAGNAIALSSWSFTTAPAPGALDGTFGTGGKVRTALGSFDDRAYAAAIQEDGKIVIAGYSTRSTVTTSVTTTISTTTTTVDYFFTIARFQSNGEIDTNTTAPFGYTQKGWSDYIVGTASTVELQSDGKIVAAGDTGARKIITTTTTTMMSVATTTLPDSDLLIARYNTNGTIDTTFGLQSNGTVSIDMGFERDAVHSLAIQSDGKIVLVGDGIDGINQGSSVYTSLIARLNTDGTLDTSFATGGMRAFTIGGVSSRAMVVKIQPDGKIVVGGNFKDGSGHSFFYLTRSESNGAPDTLFNSGIVTASPGMDPALADIAILPNGKIIVAGTTNGSTNADVFLMRFNADGTLDSTFGSAGTVITDDMIHGSETAAGLSVQADGKIVVAATFHPDAGVVLTNDFALFRYSADGMLDATFGNGYGMIATDLSNGSDDSVYAVQIQQDGRIVVVGTAANAIGMARYWP